MLGKEIMIWLQDFNGHLIICCLLWDYIQGHCNKYCRQARDPTHTSNDLNKIAFYTLSAILFCKLIMFSSKILDLGMHIWSRDFMKLVTRVHFQVASGYFTLILISDLLKKRFEYFSQLNILRLPTTRQCNPFLPCLGDILDFWWVVELRIGWTGSVYSDGWPGIQFCNQILRLWGSITVSLDISLHSNAKYTKEWRIRRFYFAYNN